MQHPPGNNSNNSNRAHPSMDLTLSVAPSAAGVAAVVTVVRLEVEEGEDTRGSMTEARAFTWTEESSEGDEGA